MVPIPAFAVGYALVLAAGFTIAAALLLLAAVFFLRAKRLQNRRDWQQRIHQVCGEAKAIVDLTTPIDPSSEPLTTSALGSVVERINHLDQRLIPLGTVARDQRTVEAIEDLRRVALSLSAALDAERALRIAGSKKANTSRSVSVTRIAKRSAEMNLVAGELLWLTETVT